MDRGRALAELTVGKRVEILVVDDDRIVATGLQVILERQGYRVVGVVATVVLVNGFGEETGWRGLAQPLLQRRHGPLVATLGVSAIWAVWHLPMFFVVEGFRSFTVAITVGWVIGLFCGAVVLTWLYNHTGSILLVALWHGTYNMISGTSAASGLLAAVSTTAVIVLAALLVVLEVRATRHGGPSILAGAQRGSGVDPAPARS